MMFLFQVGTQKTASDERLQQTQQAFQKFAAMVSTPKSDPAKTASPALAPLILFESNFDSYKSVKDAFLKGDLGGAQTSEILGKYRDYLKTVKDKIDAGLYKESMRILDKISPVAQEKPAKQGDDFRQPKQEQVKRDQKQQDRGITAPVKTTTESALALEKKIFDHFAAGTGANAEGLFASLKTALNDDVKYANFLSVLRGGVVDGKLFTSNWSNFQSLVKMVDSSVSPFSKSVTIFTCATKEEADAFRAALSQIKCIKLTKTDREDISEVSANLKNPRYVPVVFTYSKPEKEEAPVSPPVKKAESIRSSALSRTNVYRTWLDVRYSIKENADTLLATNALILSSKSEPFDINYNAKQQMIFARHFDPKDRQSQEMVRQLASEQLPRFLAEKNLKVSDLSLMKTADKIALLKEMRIVGAATLESPKQWKENYELATLRAKMLGAALIEIMFAAELAKAAGATKKEKGSSQKTRSSEIEGYMKYFGNGAGVEAKVVSPWHSAALNKLDSGITQTEASSVLNSTMGRIKSGGDESAREICAMDAERNFNASQFLLSLMTGKNNYKDAAALVTNSSLSKSDKAELLELVKRTEKTSDGKPAITYDAQSKQYAFTNEALAQRLWLMQGDSNVGLRYESAKQVDGKLVVSPPKTAKERLGAFFVSQLEEDFSRSASLLRSSQGTLSISLEDYYEEGGQRLKYTPFSQVKAGKTYYATMSVAYEVGGKKEEFNGKVYGKVYGWANNKDVEAEFVKRRGDGTYEYKLKFTPEAGTDNRIDAVAYKFFDKQRVSSGFVAAPLNLMRQLKEFAPPPAEVEAAPRAARFYPPDTKVPLHITSTTNITIPTFASGLYGSTVLNDFIKTQLESTLGRAVLVSEATGTYITGNMSFTELMALQKNIPTAFSKWMAQPDVNQWLQTNLGGKYAEFKSYLSAGNYEAAGNLLINPDGTLSPAGRAFNTFRGAMTGIQQANALNSVLNALSSPNPFVKAVVSLRLASLDENSRIDLNLYYNAQTNKFEISDQTPQNYSVKNAGAQLVLTIPNIRLKVGGGNVFVSNGLLPSDVEGLNIDQYYVQASGDAYLRLSDIFNVGLQLGYTKVFAKSGVQFKGPVSVSLLGADIGNAYIGTTAELGRLTSVLEGVTFNAGLISQVQLNNEAVGKQLLDNIGYSLGVGLNPGRILRVPLLEHGEVFFNPIFRKGSKPMLQFGVRVGIN